jgi:hypothetical protein
MPARHEEVGQCAGHEQAVGVFLQPAIAHLGEAEHPLDDPDRMFDPRFREGRLVWGFSSLRAKCLHEVSRFVRRELG